MSEQEQIMYIQELVKDLLIIKTNKSKLRPAKNTSRQDCYNAILKIQETVNVNNREWSAENE